MLPIQDPVLQLTVLLLAALVAQLTVERAQLPGLLGLLILGVLLGPGGFGVLEPEPIVSFLGHVGLIYVMFIAGLEINLDTAREHAREVVSFGTLAFLCCLIPTASAGLLLGFPLPAALLLGALISSHTLVAYPIVRRQGLLRRLSVVTAVGGTLLTDTAALVLLALVLSMSGGEGGLWSSLAPLGMLVVLVAAALWSVPRLGRLLLAAETLTRAEKALFALAVLLVLAAATDLIGTDEVLGAFLAGVCLNRPLAKQSVLREHIEFVGRMLFIPFFLVYTGMLLNVGRVFAPGVLLLGGLLLLVIAAGKSAAAWITGKRYGFGRRDRLLIIGMTTPQAAATLAIAITGQEAGLLEAELMDAVVLVIFVTCAAGPLLTSAVGRRLRRDDEGEGAASGEARDEAIEREL